MQKYAVPLLSLALGVIGAQATVYVKLQNASPGTKENGNINISGNVISGKVMAGLSSSSSIITAYSPLSTTTAFQGSARNFGVRGQTTAPSGLAYGGYFDTTSPNGYGAWLKNKATTGTAIGLFAETASPVGIAGDFFTSSDTGQNVAVRARVNTSSISAPAVEAIGKDGYGVFARCPDPAGIGVSSRGGSTGVVGQSDFGIGISGATGGINGYGIRGIAPTGGTGHAIFAVGTYGATGTKSLVIDHPDDPTNKYLLQFCAEGDTPQLQYRGMVSLDSNGAAVVQLPAYFEKINRDPIYQLTAVGGAMPNLHVAEKVKHNRFRIAGGKPGAEVSWTVIGIRNDNFVKRYGAKTEREKPAENRGTYLMPELYGQPKQMAEGYSEKTELTTQTSSTPPPNR